MISSSSSTQTVPAQCVDQTTPIQSTRLQNYPTDFFFYQGRNGEPAGFSLVEKLCTFSVSATATADQQLTQSGSVTFLGTISGDCATDIFNWQFVCTNNGPGPGVGITLPSITLNQNYPCQVTYRAFHSVYDLNNNQLSKNFMEFSVPQVIGNGGGIVRRLNTTFYVSC